MLRVLVPATVCCLACLPVPGRQTERSALPRHEARPASPLEALARRDLDGVPVAPGRLRGHVVVVNFWATWCAPCLAEMPALSDWQRTEGSRGLQVIGVAMDDDAGPVRSAVRRLHLRYPVVMGDAPLARAFGGVLGMPVTVVLDRNGTVAQRIDGPLDLPRFRRQLATLLREGERTSGGGITGARR